MRYDEHEPHVRVVSTVDIGRLRDFLRVKQVAAMLDVHPSTIYRAIETGALTALRVGQGRGGLRISRAAYERFLANSIVEPASGPGGAVA